jgi:hypothetical protein
LAAGRRLRLGEDGAGQCPQPAHRLAGDEVLPPRH